MHCNFRPLLLLTILVCMASVDTARAVPTRVVSETNGEIVIEIIDDTGPFEAAVAKLYVAVSPTGTYNLSVETGGLVEVADTVRFEGGIPFDSLRAAYVQQADTLRIEPAFSYRGARVIYVEFNLFLFPSNSRTAFRMAAPRLRVTYTPSPLVNDRVDADPLLRELVVNENIFPTTARQSSSDPWFDQAGQWIKIPIEERGVYAITGSDLAGLGVQLPAIQDPGTLRLFTTGGVNQSRDFADPAGTWQRGAPMRETAIVVEDGGDGTFDPDDRIVFYGMPATEWADFYDAQEADTVFHAHSHTNTNYYFLTWDLPGNSVRVANQSAAPVAGAEIATYEHRVYQERNLISDLDYGGDGWLWLDISAILRALLSTVSVSDLVASRPQTFRTVALSRYRSPLDTLAQNAGHRAIYEVESPPSSGTWEEVTRLEWDALPSHRRFEDGLPVRFEGAFLSEGANVFRLRTDHVKERMFFAWYSVFYHRRIKLADDAVGFTSPDTTGTVNFMARGAGTKSTYVFDVTDPLAIVRLTGATQVAGNVRFAASLNGERKHFWVSTVDGLKTPESMARYSPHDLRADATGAHMLIVTHREFLSGANRLRAHREQHLPYFSNPTVRVVTTDEIFDNFSGGMTDPMAIRNYIRFLYDNYADSANNPLLSYVLFFGDATTDFRNYISQQVDFVPTNLYLTVLTPFAMATDEWFGHLDAGDLVPGRAVADVALGRLPAASRAEADQVASRIVDYETRAPRESWRTETILVADDEISSFEFACETQWTLESEGLTNNYTPGFFDVGKIYLVEYDEISGVKPESRFDFLERWSDGAIVINYIGHGSSQQMADEQVFLGTDVSLMNNGLKLPLLMAFSCTIGDFANPLSKSMSEKLLLRDGGGVIGTVTASRDTYPAPNKRLNSALFERIFPPSLRDERPALGVGVMHSKLFALNRGLNQPFQEENNWKYNLLCDPALRLAVPEREVRFFTAQSDTMVAGLRKTVRGGVFKDGVLDTSFNGDVLVKIREPDSRRKYITRCAGGVLLPYRYPAGVMYKGTTDVVGGEFEVSFRVPRFAETGTLAFATAYANSGTIDASMTMDSVLVVVPPTAADSTQLVPRDGAPRVSLGFKSGLTTVKSGETLRAIVNDADGINILETTNEGKQAILFDNVPVPIDVNEFFSFDHGGADTSGVLLFPLPELSFGDHRLIYKVSDSFGLLTLDTLLFSVTDPLAYTAEVLLNYPNPFSTTTQFLFRLSDRAKIQLDIFTVSGKRIRRIEDIRDGGEVWINWDGRDGVGDEIANGTYLYVARVSFVGVTRTPVTVRGRVSKIR